MKQKKDYVWARLFSSLLIFCMVFTLWHVEPVYAAISYSNAQDFYENVGRNSKTKCENGNFYFATKAKRASRARTLTRAGRTTFSTLGFDITLFTDEASVDIGSFYELAVKADTFLNFSKC